MARLSPERRAKIEDRTDELHREYLTLKKLREKLNLTQAEMATRVGVKQPAISKLENGERRLTFDTFSTIVASLGGEWELNVKLPDIGTARFTSNEDFEDKVSLPASRRHRRQVDGGGRRVKQAKKNKSAKSRIPAHLG